MSDIGTMKVLEIIENGDGTCTIVFDISDEFRKNLREALGVKRLTQKRFQKFFLEAVDQLLKREKNEKAS